MFGKIPQVQEGFLGPPSEGRCHVPALMGFRRFLQDGGCHTREWRLAGPETLWAAVPADGDDNTKGKVKPNL